VNKIKISRVPVVESPCCKAPSTSMNQDYGLTKNKDRRCVRCRQAFCRIGVDDSERPLKAVVGARE
jgi:hypothetical protein